jgi:Common central domain of tyrosinase
MRAVTNLLGAVALAAAAALTVFASAAPVPGTPQFRMRWQDFAKDPARVASLVRGIETMKKRNSAAPTSIEYRGSWQYWAAMHGYYGADSSFGTVADGVALLTRFNLQQFVGRFTGIVDLAPPDALAKEIWERCQHSYFDQDNQFVPQNFFGWHRLYLYYFERVLRAAAQDDTLRLPYWDYTDPAQGKLPSEFGSVNGQAVNAALFDARRAPGLNDGTQVVSPLATNIDTVLGNDTFEGIGGFSWAIERGVHGNIHCIVGSACPVPFMGAVAVSANDPIFWLHHANIDRLFECWMQKSGKKPTGSFVTDKFVFVDETGTRRERAVSAVLDGGTLEYRYDNVANCMRVPDGPTLIMNTANGQPAPRPSVTLASAKDVTLGTAVVTVALPKPAAGAGPGADDAVIAAAEAIDLVLGKVAWDRAPGVMFHIYLGRPGAPISERKYVGTLNFFTAGEGGHGGHGSMTQSFDATRQTKALSAGAAANASLEVTFESTTGLDPAPGTAAGPPVAAPPSAPTTIGSIELRTRSKQ